MSLDLPPHFGECVQKGIAKLRNHDGKVKVEQNGRPGWFSVAQHCAEVFGVVRETLLGQSSEDFFKEVCNSGDLPQPKMNKTGKSGSFFIISPHRLYIIKYVTDQEFQCLKKISADYLAHLQQYPDSLLCRVCGLYRVTTSSIEGNLNLGFMVMRSAFGVDRQIAYAYDLKGTTEDRYMTRNGAVGQVLKDLNFEEDQGVLVLPGLLYHKVQSAAHEDVRFLQSHGIMDYSLLVGIYKVREGEREDFGAACQAAEARETSMLKLKTFPGWRRDGDGVMISFCIVDMLQCWTVKKKSAHLFKKCVFGCCHKIDTEPPGKYGQRFAIMVSENLRPGESDDFSRTTTGVYSTASTKTTATTTMSGSTHGFADHLSLCSKLLKSREMEDDTGLNLSRLLALSDLMMNCDAKPLEAAGLVQCSVTSSELERFRQTLCDEVLPPAGKKTFGDVWSSYASTFQSKCALKGKLIKNTSKKYMLACAVSVGVDASTQVSECMDEHFQPLWKAHPDLLRRPAAYAGFRCLHLPERGSWLSEAHHVPSLVFWELAPEEFRRLRVKSGWTDTEYRKSICGGNFSFIQFSSNSKSGQFFFFTGDSRLLVKTVSAKEVGTMRRLLMAGYVDHVTSEEGSLLTRIYGVYKVKAFSGSKAVFFIVQDNMLAWPNFAVHRRFDLKGATRNRRAKDSESVLKDLNWEGNISLEPAERSAILSKHRRDCAFLAEGRVLDYSVMVGIHQPVARQETRELHVQYDHLEPPEVPKKKTGWGLLKKMVDSRSGSIGLYGPYEGLDKRKFLVGIIDYMIPWDCKKYSEHIYKKLTWKAKGTACVPPSRYAARQIAFIESLMAQDAVKVQPAKVGQPRNPAKLDAMRAEPEAAPPAPDTKSDAGVSDAKAAAKYQDLSVQETAGLPGEIVSMTSFALVDSVP